MRDAELRFATLRMRIEERSRTARGDDARPRWRSCFATRATRKVTTSRAGEGATGRLRGLDLRRRARPDVRARRTGSGTQRPIRNRPRGLGRSATSRARPGSTSRSPRCRSETLPDTFVHPAGFCQNVLATGRCPVTGTDVVGRSRGDPARVRPPAHDRDRRRPPGLPHPDRGRPRDRRHPAPGRDRSAATVTRHAEVDRARARCAARRRRVRLRVPDRDDDALLTSASTPDGSKRPADGRAFVRRGPAGQASQLEVALDGGQLLGGCPGPWGP